MDYTKDLHELCEVVSEQISEMTRKVKGGNMSTSDVEMLDKLTHTLKSIKSVIKMMDDEDYSGYYPYGGYRGSYARKRDSMGRYSSERGYSRNDLKDKLHDLMEEASDDRTRNEIQRLIEKM